MRRIFVIESCVLVFVERVECNPEVRLVATAKMQRVMLNTEPFAVANGFQHSTTQKHLHSTMQETFNTEPGAVATAFKTPQLNTQRQNEM